MNLSELKNLLREKMAEFKCLHTHKHYDKATVGKMNLEKLEFDFTHLCITCKPMRWIGKRSRVADRSEQ